MDEFTKWWDAPKDVATLQDRYRECWKAGREAGMRDAVHALLARFDRGDIIQIAAVEAAILAAIDKGAK